MLHPIKKCLRKILNFNISRKSSSIMIGTQHFIGDPVMFVFAKKGLTIPISEAINRRKPDIMVTKTTQVLQMLG